MRKKYESEYELVSFCDGKKKYRYRGAQYRLNLKDSDYSRFWIFQLTASVLSLLLLLLAGQLPSRSMYHFYAFLPYILTYIPALFFLIHSAFCPRKNHSMEHMEYDQQYGRQKLSVFLALIGSILAAVTGFLAVSLDPQAKFSSCLQPLLLCLLALLLALFLRILLHLPVSVTEGTSTQK
ncbi:MAG: hypothetical protein LUF00_01610 [Lachnospiraceae bacterium]|nr:hypothetical protein [Lachnospiraceae bacterium]